MMTVPQINSGEVANPRELEPLLIEPEQLVNMLRAVRDQIPEYVQLPKADKRALQAAASVDKAFVERVIRATGEAEVVQQAIGMTPPQMQQESIDAGRWDAVEEQLRALLEGVSSANRIRKHRLGLAALQAYNICRQLVRKKAYADLLPHVQEMSALIKAGRKSAVKPEPAAPVTNTVKQ
jgi:hypothetical protein